MASKRLSKNIAPITEIILNVVKVAGVISVAIVAPNALVAFKKLGLLEGKKYRPISYLNKRTQSMIDQGLLKKIFHQGVYSIILTEKGRIRLRKHQIVKNTAQKKEWDGKWRVLTFDVWEKRRVSRNQLRMELKNFGFTQLQRSVWIYPYPCEEFIELLKTSLKFGKNVRYLLAEKVDDDANLKKYFKLNK
jgi:hypothetical protein